MIDNGLDFEGLSYYTTKIKQHIEDKLLNKVDKIDGKGLSSNDLTDELKENYDKAQENVIETVKVNNVTLSVEDKTVNIEIPNTDDFVTKSANNLENYYLKSETYTQEEVNQLLATVSSLNIESVTTLPTTNISTTTIYLVPKIEGVEEQNIYLEYINLDGTSDGWECIGDTKVDLNNYADKAFSSVKVGTATLSADSKSDTLELVAGDNITITADTTNDKITISSTDTKYSEATTNVAGLMSATDKAFLNRLDRESLSLVPRGTSIGSNKNLNTTEFIKVGKYYCSMNATVATLTNCPTTSAFMMEVYSPLSTTYDNESTAQYVYRLRKLTTYTGAEYTQSVSSDTTAGTFTYGTWRRTDTDTTYTHPDSGVTEGIYRSVTVDKQGHVIAGSNPILSVSEGGTGATTANEAQYNLLKDAQIETISDNSQLAGIYVTPTVEKGVFWRATFLKLWDYIKDKISSVLGLTDTNYNGNSATATTATKLSNTSAIGSSTNPVYFNANGVPQAVTYPLNAKIHSTTGLTEEYKTKFRTETSGSNSNGNYISSVRTSKASVSGLPQYGASLAWGSGDTHALLSTSYSGGLAYIGAGNADKLLWQKQIAFTDSNITGNAATATNASKVNNHTVNADVPSDAKFTDTVYTHPTSSGNKHIPSGGSSGQFLKWSSDGTATWASDNDTKNTAGSTNSSSKLFLIGATSQATNPQTYSHDTVYVDTDGCLYSNSTKVSVEGHTHSEYAPTSHGTHVSFTTTAPKALGTASVGSATTVSRSDHVHPLPSNATTSANGLMTSTMVTKLNGIEEGANKTTISSSSAITTSGAYALDAVENNGSVNGTLANRIEKIYNYLSPKMINVITTNNVLSNSYFCIKLGGVCYLSGYVTPKTSGSELLLLTTEEAPIINTDFTCNPIGKLTSTGTVNTSGEIRFNVPADCAGVGIVFNFSYVVNDFVW